MMHYISLKLFTLPNDSIEQDPAITGTSTDNRPSRRFFHNNFQLQNDEDLFSSLSRTSCEQCEPAAPFLPPNALLNTVISVISRRAFEKGNYDHGETTSQEFIGHL